MSRWLSKADLDRLKTLDYAVLIHGFSQFDDLQALDSLVGKVVADTRCEAPNVASALATKAEEYFPEQKMIDLALENPEELWDPILEILKRDPPTEVIEVLAAGPLEDYIAKLGERVIDRVEVQAAADAKFRNLLGGVWRNSMSDAVWARVQACWDRSGWDGNV